MTAEGGDEEDAARDGLKTVDEGLTAKGGDEDKAADHGLSAAGDALTAKGDGAEKMVTAHACHSLHTRPDGPAANQEHNRENYASSHTRSLVVSWDGHESLASCGEVHHRHDSTSKPHNSSGDKR